MSQNERDKHPFLIFITALLALVFSTDVGQAQVTSNVLRRVVMIQAGDLAGTGFTIEVDGRQYLITAKHVVADFGETGSINVRRGDNSFPVNVKIFRCDDPIDIAVLVPPEQLTVTFPLEPRLVCF
ncbi:MAG: hypothetical protein IH861_14650 [Chloroflexi bacterium]|nr:hypothetical protein [Chloroflexota bacterium]